MFNKGEESLPLRLEQQREGQSEESLGPRTAAARAVIVQGLSRSLEQESGSWVQDRVPGWGAMGGLRREKGHYRCAIGHQPKKRKGLGEQVSREAR